MSDFIRVNDYDCIKLDEYQGKYSIVLGYEKKDGEFGLKYGKQEFGKGNEKTVPVKVPLGNLESAKAALTSMLQQLELGGSDVPF